MRRCNLLEPSRPQEQAPPRICPARTVTTGQAGKNVRAAEELGRWAEKKTEAADALEGEAEKPITDVPLYHKRPAFALFYA